MKKEVVGATSVNGLKERLFFLNALPFQIRIHFLPAGLNRAGCAKVKVISVNLHHARLRLPDPIWKQRDEHGVGECPRLLCDMELARVSDIRATTLLSALRLSALTACA